MKRKILIVDDEYIFVKFLKRNLERGGFDVDFASDGEEGVDKAINSLPDLILLDLSMPKKDGFQVIRELKDNKLTKGVPVIVISAMDPDDFVSIVKKFDIVDYISKPCEFDALLSCINRNIIQSQDEESQKSSSSM